MKNQIKRHLISFLVTFVGSFLFLIYPAIATGEWTSAAMLSAAIAAIRGAVKLAYEAAVLPLSKYLISLYSGNNEN